MGIAIGIVLVAATIASFVMINARASRMARQYRDDGQWTVDPQTGQPVPPQHGQVHGGHHGAPHHGGGSGHAGGGGHHGGGFGGGHFGAGNHGGGHDGGGFSGGGGHHG